MGFGLNALAAGLDFAGKQQERSDAKKAQAQNMQMNADNIQLQKDFAQQGIQWKVADAKAAGIHPLYAMGSSVTPFTPSSIPAQQKPSGGFASMGQNVARAIEATSTSEQRAQAALTTENMKLQNDLLKTQIGDKVAKQPVGPPMPGKHSDTVIPGQGDASPSYAYSKNADGSLDITPSQDFTDKNQNFISGIVPEIKNFFRNQLFPGRGGHPDFINRDGKIYERRGSQYVPLKPFKKRPSNPYYTKHRT